MIVAILLAVPRPDRSASALPGRLPRCGGGHRAGGGRWHRRLPGHPPVRRFHGPDRLRDGHLPAGRHRPDLHDVLDAVPQPDHLGRAPAPRSDAALEGKARWGLGLLAFQAVGREGLETMVFTLAIVFASTNTGRRPRPTVTAFSSVPCSAWPWPSPSPTSSSSSASDSTSGLFFRIIGIVLMVFAAGLLVDAVENMQELGWLPFLDHTLWNTSTLPVRVELHRRRVPQPARVRRPADRPPGHRVGHLPGSCHHRLRPDGAPGTWRCHGGRADPGGRATALRRGDHGGRA